MKFLKIKRNKINQFLLIIKYNNKIIIQIINTKQKKINKIYRKIIK